jgi:hypothetical protein
MSSLRSTPSSHPLLSDCHCFLDSRPDHLCFLSPVFQDLARDAELQRSRPQRRPARLCRPREHPDTTVRSLSLDWKSSTQFPCTQFSCLTQFSCAQIRFLTPCHSMRIFSCHTMRYDLSCHSMRKLFLIPSFLSPTPSILSQARRWGRRGPGHTEDSHQGFIIYLDSIIADYRLSRMNVMKDDDIAWIWHP